VGLKTTKKGLEEGLAAWVFTCADGGAGIGHVPSIPGDEQSRWSLLAASGAFAQAGCSVVGLLVVPQVPWGGVNG
jgi:hypothetical protein